MKHKKTFMSKTFYGGGVVLYHGKKLLLQKIEGRDFWEDFGGKTDKEDESIIKTAFREGSEESNKILNTEFLEELINLNKKKCYYLLQNNTYFLYVIYVPRIVKDILIPEKFGDTELHDGIKRKVEWVDKGVSLHPRIRYKF